MATLGNALVTKILGHTKAEQAFTPWWDNLQDFLVYGLVMLGLIVAPTAIVSSSPLECIMCSPNQTNCREDKLHTEGQNMDRTEWRQDAELYKGNRWWVNKFCLMEAMDRFMLYFPYILLIMALVLVLIQRGFIRAFKTGMRLDTFYNILVKENAKDDENNKDKLELDTEDSRSAIEVSHSFNNSSHYHLSYVLRTVGELVVACALFAWLGFRGVPSIGKKPFILCNVYETRFECAGHPQQFYMYVTFIVLVLLVNYILCALYNLAWLSFSRLGVLSRVMTKYYALQRATKGKDKLLSDKDMLGDLWDIYYNNRDLKLLLDLLAESSGIATALRILALFDKSLRSKIEPSNVSVRIDAAAAAAAAAAKEDAADQDQFHSLVYESRHNSLIGGSAGDGGPIYSDPDYQAADTMGPIYSQPMKKQNGGGPAPYVTVTPGKDTYDAVVEFEDAEAIKDMFSCIKNLSYLYTVEIQPPTSSTSVQSIRINEDGEPDFFLSVQHDVRLHEVDATDSAEVVEISDLNREEPKKPKKMGVPLIGLEAERAYTVRISTIVNGRTIARKVEHIKPLKPKSLNKPSQA